MSLEQGRKARDRGMARAEATSPPGWIDAAVDMIEKVARARSKFTSDEVWAAGLPPPPEPRALGPAFEKARRAKIIARTGEFKQTSRGSRHAAPIAIWESLVFNGHYEEPGQ